MLCGLCGAAGAPARPQGVSPAGALARGVGPVGGAEGARSPPGACSGWASAEVSSAVSSRPAPAGVVSLWSPDVLAPRGGVWVFSKLSSLRNSFY